MSTPISRATFLKALAGCAVAGAAGNVYWQWTNSQPRFPCRMLGPSRELGHRLRTRSEEKLPISKGSSSEVLIVGGGIAGLSAAWWLKKHGQTDFLLLELEQSVGGNSTSGRNGLSAYPWGAHYVPLPNQESVYVRQLFDELGIISSTDRVTGLPVFDDLFLCHEPQERLFKDGSFQEGLVPKRGLQKAEQAELQRFFALISDLKHATGYDGRPAFAIPLDLSSADPRFRSLDQISMQEWMTNNGFRAKPLLWYVNYCCRDDYGSTLSNVSAWAGLHYFAGRRGRAANAESDAVVTWPEGNGFLANKLRDKVEQNIRVGSLVTKIVQDGEKLHVVTFRPASNQLVEMQAGCVIFCAPRFVAAHVLEQFEGGRSIATEMTELAYAPWMVANISLRQVPAARGVSLAWDNVSYYSDSLGYVVANHQEISTRAKPLVITYYHPLSDQTPKAARMELYKAQPEQWSKKIVDDLEKLHPGIATEIISMDLWPWGHGMIRPSVGFIWSETRKRMKDPIGNLFFAHSDMSGMSNFEEAQYQGVEAAKLVLAKLGRREQS